MDAQDVPGWPAGVRRITVGGLGDFGVKDSTGELFFKGERMITEKRFSWVERSLAIAGLAIGATGAAAAIVQAWAAVAALG